MGNFLFGMPFEEISSQPFAWCELSDQLRAYRKAAHPAGGSSQAALRPLTGIL